MNAIKDMSAISHLEVSFNSLSQYVWFTPVALCVGESRGIYNGIEIGHDQGGGSRRSCIVH